MNEQDWLSEGMAELCNREGVDFEALLDRVSAGEDEGVGMIFTAAEVRIIKAALEVAGGI